MIMRNRFDEQLNYLNAELVGIGALCEDAIRSCVKYLIEDDAAMRERTLDADRQIDQKERDIEQLCMKLLIQQQPVAGDLRTISSALRMIADIERIGDQAVDIADIMAVCRRNNENGIDCAAHIAEMAEATIKMVTGSMTSFVKKDVQLAHDVIAHDDVVDGLFDKVKNELIQSVRLGQGDGETLLDLLMVAKYFERIGDHAENIAEWVIYSITGEYA